MNPSQDSFRDRLLQSERVTPSLKERHEQEIREMIEKQLTTPGRIVWGLSGALGLVFMVVISIVAIVAEAPWQARVGLAGSGLFGLGWAYLGFKVYRRGSIDLKVDPAIYSGLAWCLPIFLVTMFGVWAPNNLMGLRMIVTASIFLLIGAVFLIQNFIMQSELKTREKLLEIEYRLAELAEAVKPGGLGGDRA
jgi:hypothetical protein